MDAPDAEMAFLQSEMEQKAYSNHGSAQFLSGIEACHSLLRDWMPRLLAQEAVLKPPHARTSFSELFEPPR
jgi:hypothetical protein